MSKRVVIFDLDGTLALNEHRQHFLEVNGSGKKDWNGFFDNCDKDLTNYPVLSVLLNMQENFDVRIWTGRTDRVKRKTVKWLDEHCIDHIPLKMRDEKDHTSDVNLKQSWLNELVEKTGEKPFMTFEDRNSVVDMWRSNGIVCMQVAKGDF